MQIGIIGSWDNDLPERIYDTAEQAGRLIAQQGDEGIKKFIRPRMHYRQ